MRSKNPEKYDPLYMDVMEAVCEGRVIELPFGSEKEAKAFRTNMYAFATAVGHALYTNCKGLSELYAERVRARHSDYGQLAVMLVPGGLKIMLKSMTPLSQKIRVALQQSIMLDHRVEPSKELTELHAVEMAKKYGMATEGPAAEQPTPEEKRASEEALARLGKPNPYY